MKTVFIYNTVNHGIEYFVKEGDFRHLDKVYINMVPDSKEFEQKQDELMGMVLNDQGEYTIDFLDKFPQEEIKDGNFVVEVGFFD